MEKKFRIPEFKNIDQEMDYYANIDVHVPMREATPEEVRQLDKELGIRRRKVSVPRPVMKTKPGKKAS